jgi:hypothetical protein
MEIIDGAVAVEVEGQTADLRELVGELVQFITPDILHESSVLFVRLETAVDIKVCMKNGGAFVGERGKRLECAIKTLVYGRPIHSHLSE